MAPDKLRPGSAAAGLLWKLKKDKIDQWSQTLDSYKQCIELLNKALSKAQANLSKQKISQPDSPALGSLSFPPPKDSHECLPISICCLS